MKNEREQKNCYRGTVIEHIVIYAIHTTPCSVFIVVLILHFIYLSLFVRISLEIGAKFANFQEF